MKRLLCWILSLCLLLCLVPGAAAAERVTGTLERRAGYDLASVRCELAGGSYFFASVEETAAGYAYDKNADLVLSGPIGEILDQIKV